MVSEFSAIAMYFVGGVVFKKYRESENQKPREYLYRSVLVFFIIYYFLKLRKLMIDFLSWRYKQGKGKVASNKNPNFNLNPVL